MWLRSRLTASPPFWPALRASARENSCAVPCLWAARPPSAAIARWRVSLSPAKPRPLLAARLEPRVAARDFVDLGDERRARVVDDLRRDRVDLGFVARGFVERDVLEDFFAADRRDLVSPFSRRILLTVRAATSSARRPYRPDFFALCLM